MVCGPRSKFDVDNEDDDDEYKDTFDDNTNEGSDTVWDTVPGVLYYCQVPPISTSNDRPRPISALISVWFLFNPPHHKTTDA